MGTAHLLRLLSLLTGITVLQQVRSWSITVPKTITAVEGSCVVVPCQTQPHFRVTWYQYHNIQYPVVYDGRHPNTVAQQFRGRTSVPGKAAEGNCTLMINNVKRADNNLKVYVWINPDLKSTQKFHDTTVTIFVERKAPIISIQEQIVDGETFQVNCSVSYSCPFTPPSLQWNKSASLNNCILMAFSKRVQGQWLYTQTLRGQATYDMNNSKMSCSAKFTAFTAKSQQITFKMLYKPVTVTLMLVKEPVMEGDSVMVECVANSNPQPHTYSWLKKQMGQNTKINSTQRKMAFNNIMRDTFLSCVAHNDIGAGESDWLDLDVQYAPVILPESSCHLIGEVLKCICQAEASPNASIYWTIDGNDTFPSSFSLVSTNKKNFVSAEISGPATSQSNISCTATNSLGSNSKQLSVYNLSKISTLPILLSALMPLGIAFLFGCAMFMYRRYCRNGLPLGSVYNTCIILRPQDFSDIVQQEERYSCSQRAQNEDTRSSPCRPESNPEVDRLSCVYDNEMVEEMQSTRARQPQNNAAALQREGKIRPQGVYCNMDHYLNC